MSAVSLRLSALVVTLAVTAAACSSSSDQVVLLTHDSFALSEETLASFTEDTGIEVVIQFAGDAGTMLNQAILTKDNPIADVMFGVDNTFLSRAIDNGIFAPYEAVDISSVSSTIRVQGDFATPIDFGDVCVNYDIAALDKAGIAAPQNLGDLTDPAYRDLLVVEDPALSSPGLAFLMATIAEYPDGASYDWKAYWSDLFDNGVAVSANWTEAYTSRFSRSGGDRPLVVSYASSPPAEVLFGELDEAPTGIMTNGCFRQIEFAGVLAGTDNEKAARLFIDFLLARTTQEDIPLNMFVYPVNDQAKLPDVFSEFTTLPQNPVVTEPGTIEANRERWIREWTTIARS
ncbi:MAG: thiamine ABC transporter substrate-binding protein [Acidimicrobiia bacterium]|nr:MAG: thiamine ABC transporter substrate-binding protein [Acidimicrobiia bacterium]